MEEIGQGIRSGWLTVERSRRRRNCEDGIVWEEAHDNEDAEAREPEQKGKRGEENHKVSFKRERRLCLDGPFGSWCFSLSASLSFKYYWIALISLGFCFNYWNLPYFPVFSWFSPLLFCRAWEPGSAVLGFF